MCSLFVMSMMVSSVGNTCMFLCSLLYPVYACECHFVLYAMSVLMLVLTPTDCNIALTRCLSLNM